MGEAVDIMRCAAQFAGEVVAETLWPTRCALCEKPGSVLCENCALSLPFLDSWRACPRCGAPFGKVQCDWCNPVSLSWLGRDSFPFAGCASATMFNDATSRLVRVYKDQGERRLAREMAHFMAHAVRPSWTFDAITFTPATKAAWRRRGFDHMEIVAQELAQQLSVELIRTLDRPVTRDQRELASRGRIANLKDSFNASTNMVAGRKLLLIDDVMTTGSTICAASDALLEAGANEVFCLTFTRV